ncbi:MAG: hypothetical protein ACOYLB_06185 [Phototrophicaceae bacterium]
MGFESQRYTATEPIILFTYQGKLNNEVFRHALDMNAHYIEELGEPIYIIADVRNLETTFSDMLHIMQEARQDRPGSVHDERIAMLAFVGSSPFIKMYRDTMLNRGTAYDMTIYDTLEEAVEVMRIAIKMNKGKDGSISQQVE